MKKMLLIVLCLLVTMPASLSNAAEQEYTAYMSFGFGPLEGEMSSPCAIGSDESGRIYAIDKASRKGLVFLENGNYFKTVAVPEDVDLEKMANQVSVNTGMIAYPNGKFVHVASSTGEVSYICGLGMKNVITEPLKVKLMDDMSCYVLDKNMGLFKFDREGNLSAHLAAPGKPETLPNLLSFDVSSSGDIAILSIWMDAPGSEEGAPEPNKVSNVQISVFDASFKQKTSFKVKTTEQYSPRNGDIAWYGSTRIFFMSCDMTGITEFDASGNQMSETLMGGMWASKSFVPAKERFFFYDGTELSTIKKDGSDSKVIGQFVKEPMKFGRIEQITSCQDGFAVYDSSRKDIQFFSGKGFSGLKSYDQNVNIVLFTDLTGRTCVLNPTNRTVKVYGCDGNQSGSFELDPQLNNLSRICNGLGEEFLGVSREDGAVYRISKEGFFISRVGGSEGGQFVEPVDAFAGQDKNVYVMDAAGVIRVFDSNSKYLRTFGMPEGQKKLNKPSAMIQLPTGDIMISDSGNDRLVVLGTDGSLKYTTGGTSPVRIKTKMGDYFTDIGTFSNPGQFVVSGDSIYVIDRGNLRIQVLRKEKVAPKITVSRQSIDFGKVSTGTKSEYIIIKNSGNGVLEGSVAIDVPWIELPKKTFAGNEAKLEIKLLADKVPYWNSQKATVIINSNGGFIKIEVSAGKPGKLVRLQVNSTKAYVDEVETAMTVPPTLVNGSTMVPLRFIGEVLGATVDWNADDKKVTYVLGKRVVIVWIGKKDALVNGSGVTMSVAPVIIKGKTLVPLRFIGEALGASVEWIASTKTILVYYPPKN